MLKALLLGSLQHVVELDGERNDDAATRSLALALGDFNFLLDVVEGDAEVVLVAGIRLDCM